MGCQLSWAVQIGYTTPTLRQLGLDRNHVGFVWLAGPLSGLVVQPIIGAWSDHSNFSLGRRRPFVLFGAALTVFGLLLFSNAEQLGQAVLGDTPTSHPAGLIIAIIAFWFLDCAINVTQAPMRALLSDLAPAGDQSWGNAMFGLHNVSLGHRRPVRASLCHRGHLGTLCPCS